MKRIYSYFLLIGSFILIFVLGVSIGYLYSFTDGGPFDGYYFRDSSEPEFYMGDWVCVNVRGMSYERALDVCSHEVGHEIFAEICEDDIDKCFKIAEDLGNEG